MSLESKTLTEQRREHDSPGGLKHTCQAIVAALATTEFAMRTDPLASAIAAASTTTTTTTASSSLLVSVSPRPELAERGLTVVGREKEGESRQSSVDVEEDNPALQELVRYVDASRVNSDHLPPEVVPPASLRGRPRPTVAAGATSDSSNDDGGDFISLQRADIADLYDIPALVRAVREGLVARGEMVLLVFRGVRNIFAYELSDSDQLQRRLRRYFGDVLANVLEQIYPDRGDTPVVSDRRHACKVCTFELHQSWLFQ